MKKCITAVLVLVFIMRAAVCACAVFDVSAKSAIVIDMASGRILFEKDAYTKRGPASTTKILTALIAIESLDGQEIVTVSPNAAGVEGSSIWLEPLEKISVEDLLYGLLLASGNDAATALAEHTAGSEEMFVVMMNERAAKIGTHNSNFTNPHGLPDEEHYTTAYDLALISAEAMKNERFAKIAATENKSISWEGSEWNRSLSNHNKLLKMYEYATGIKTGYTKKDGRCLVSSASKDGLELIAVTLSAPDDWNDHIKMLEGCYEKFKGYVACRMGEEAELYKNDNANDIRVIYASDFVTALTEEEIKSICVKNSFDFKYPVKRGQKIGQCEIFLKDKCIGSVDLIADNDSAERKKLFSVVKILMKGIMLR